MNMPQKNDNVQAVDTSCLNQVTPLSKYLAMILFVLLPFIGGFIGYTNAPEKVIEVETIKLIKESSPTPQASNTNVRTVNENGRSLSIILTSNGEETEFAKDDKQVYLKNETGYSPLANVSADVSEIDANTFEAVGSRHIFFKDKNHVYFTNWQEFSTIEEADPNTFSVIQDDKGNETEYAKDKDRVFFAWKLVTGANPDTFVKMASTTFAKDISHVFSEDIYYSTDIVSGANPITFIPFTAKDGAPSIYGKDSTSIYCGSGKIIDADIETFAVQSPWSATDTYRTYDGCSVYDPSNP